ncbi:holotricin-3-like isoform X1 [Eriocheir sinensis]|uniref:holotricin-3-like isoform X1 n=2 Tax=Eriocheir sinensis TaxID=95602 RepID=UPI0021C66FF5|nr:holotricin-3-like isoform X1 [Eriocheir sinensis]XP_050735362.1 holotricin-3-like isoform X2 [Eriocheir sinensis]XP_050735363.1 holotricin-3-like isoform X1 [Eriocheir sinensis]
MGGGGIYKARGGDRSWQHSTSSLGWRRTTELSVCSARVWLLFPRLLFLLRRFLEKMKSLLVLAATMTLLMAFADGKHGAHGGHGGGHGHSRGHGHTGFGGRHGHTGFGGRHGHGGFGGGNGHGGFGGGNGQGGFSGGGFGNGGFGNGNVGYGGDGRDESGHRGSLLGRGHVNRFIGDGENRRNDNRNADVLPIILNP